MASADTLVLAIQEKLRSSLPQYATDDNPELAGLLAEWEERRDRQPFFLHPLECEGKSDDGLKAKVRNCKVRRILHRYCKLSETLCAIDAVLDVFVRHNAIRRLWIWRIRDAQRKEVLSDSMLLKSMRLSLLKNADRFLPWDDCLIPGRRRSKIIIVVPKSSLGHLIDQFCGTPQGEKLRKLLTYYFEFQGKLNLGTTVSWCEVGLQICHEILKYPRSGDRVGPVVAAAAQFELHPLFVKSLDNICTTLPECDWVFIGQSLNLRRLRVPETTIIDSLTASGKIEDICPAIAAFREGLCESMKDGHESAYRDGWTDTVLFGALQQIPQVYMYEARSLVNMIMERKGQRLRQCIAYQNVRELLNRFEDNDITLGIAVELGMHIALTGDQDCYSLSLLKHVMSPAISRFDLQLVTDYIKTTKGLDADGYREDMLSKAVGTMLHAATPEQFEALKSKLRSSV